MKYTQAVVANVNDLKDGEMKQVSVGKTEVLLSRLEGKFYAVSARCTHYGAPLEKGVLSEHHAVCPWHNACFDVTNGEQLEPPGLDSLASYEVQIEDNKVIVRVPEANPGLKSPRMAQFDPQVDKRIFIILGAGTAGSNAAETLRMAGYQGRIIMVTQEDKLPYDRTKLSKAYLAGKASPENIQLRSPDFYKELGIEVLLNKQVKQVNASHKAITFADGDSTAYDALLVATGGKPRHLDIPGADLANIFT